MSRSYDEEVKELTAEVLELYLVVACTVFLPVYEYVITFDQEVAAVWAREKKFAVGPLLLLSTRWCMVALAIASSLPADTAAVCVSAFFTYIGYSTRRSCKPIVVTLVCLELVGFAQVAVFSALRVSAIWGRNRLLFAVVVVLGSAPVLINAFEGAFYTFIFQGGSCLSSIRLSPSALHTLDLSARIPVIVSDVLVLVLTWVKSYRQVAHARSTGQRMSLSMCLLRDGTVYFLILLALNLFALVTNSTPNATIASVFITTIPSILVNRFMLNLRQIDTDQDTQTIGQLSDFSAPRFNAADSFFGNFGEPLGHGVSLCSEESPEEDVLDEGKETGDATRAWNDSLRENENTASPSSVYDSANLYHPDVVSAGTGAEGLR